MRELKLKYIISLVSDIAAKAKTDEQALVQAQKRVQDELGKTNTELGRLERVLLRVGNVGTASAERQAQYLSKLALGYINVRKEAERTNAMMAKATNIGGGAAAVTTGAVMTVRPFVNAFADIEQATTDFKVSVMTAGKKLPKEFEAISRIAVDLGNKLPGSIKDYMQAATALASQGVSPAAIASGGLTSAAYLGVLLHMDRGEAATMVAKIREGYGLHDDELAGLADSVQRNKFAFGLSPEGIKTAASYSGATLGLLGLRGPQALSRVLTVEGMAAQAGIGDSQFGTNFAEMLMHLTTGPAAIAEAKKGMKARARAILDREDMQISFFDEHGQLKQMDGDPIKGVMRELEKFKELAKRDPEAALTVGHALFGERGLRPAMIMAQLGVEGYEKARARVTDQATLDERIAEASTTLAWKFEALGGSITNLMGKIGEQTGNNLKPLVDRANDVVGGSLFDLAAGRPDVGTAGLVAAAATGASVAARFAAWALPKVGLQAAGGLIGGSLLGVALPWIAGGTAAWAGSSMVGNALYNALPEGAQDALGSFTHMLWNDSPYATQADLAGARPSRGWRR